MKRSLILVLVFTLVLSSISYASPGDIIHTGLKKIYKDGVDYQDLINDIVKGADPSKFYRELEDGRYINIQEEEKVQLNALKNILESRNLTDQEDIKKFLENPSNLSLINDEINKERNKIIIDDFDSISDTSKGSLEDYASSTDVPRLKSPGNYSMPVFGSKANTTMIKSLIYPAGSSKWVYKILDKPDTNLKLNDVIAGIEYKAGQDIEVEAGKYIGLYATDRSNRLKSYANIKVEEVMIRRNATLMDGGILDKGKDLALSVVINGIEGSWKYVVSREELPNVFKDTKFNNPTNFVAGQDIVVADEGTVLDENFKRFIYVYSTDKNGSIDKYYKFEIDGDDISPLPERLEENINYIGPVMGTLDETTRFTMLDSSYGFMYLKDKKEIPLPALNADFSFKGISIVQDQDIEVKLGDYLLLVVVDDGRVKSYAQFKLTEDQIKGITPPKFTISPEKGNGPRTTMVRGIELSNENNKWMYALGVDLHDPVLDKVYEEAKNYNLGEDIEVELDQTLMIMETDSTGRVKRFGKASLNKDNVKASLVYNLAGDKGAYLKDPIKGSQVGTIKFEFLKYEEFDFILIKSDKPIFIPEMDSVVSGDRISKDGFGTEDIRVYDPDDEKLRADEGFRDYAMVLAVDGSNKVKAYYSFELNRNNVKLPEAGKLNSGSLVNYELIRGDGPNTTKIKKLDSTGLSSVTSFRYRLVDEEVEIEHNTIITGTSQLRENANVAGSIGKYMLILAVDPAGRTKYYATVALTDDILRYANAPMLRIATNFLEPVPGSGFNSTKVTFLRLPDDASKWMYLVLDNSYGPVEHNRPLDLVGIKTVDGENTEVEISPVKANQWLLLLAVDDNGLVKAYYNQRLGDIHVKGERAVELTEGLNYRIEKGSKAGTTRFTLLEGWGLEEAYNTRWKYKLIPYGEELIVPFQGSIDQTIPDFYAIDTDILASKDAHEYILLLATDYAGRTKAYKYIKLDINNVKEHANNIEAISLRPGTEIDTTGVLGLEIGKTYAYILSDDIFDDYAVGDFLPPGYISYKGGDIKVRLNQYLTIFELDGNGNIGKFRVFEIGEEDINLAEGTLELSSIDNILLEGSIRLGGQALRIKLDNGDWVPNIDGNPDLREKLYRGLIANNQSSEWAKLINTQLLDRFNISQSGKTLEIELVAVPNFDISEEQRINMIIDPSLVVGGVNPIHAAGEILIKPTINANISGDLVDRIIRATDIKDGGIKIEINLVDGYWKPTKDMNLNLLWNGFEGGPIWDSLVGEEGEEDALFRQNATITRTSSTRLTISLPPVVGLTWGYEKEEIRLTIHKDLLVDAVDDVIAAPSFTIYPDVLKIEGNAMADEVWLIAPDSKQVRQDHNKWRIKVTNGTLKEDVSIKDLTITGLPKNLVVTASRAEDNILDLVVSGTATTAVTNARVYVIINGSAVIEPDSIASNPIELVLKTAEPMDFSHIKYRVEGKSLVFTGITGEMEYSTTLDSAWREGDGKDVVLVLEPMKLVVREKLQPMVTKEFIFENEDEPLGVTIDSYKYIDSGEVEVQLNGIDKDTMEYSIDGGLSYQDFEDEENITISLGDNGDLRVRYKAVNGEGPAGRLPSNPTPRLNGIYLGNVVLAAGEGKIKHTSANMEYSLGSTTGTDGIWTPAKGNETNVAFSVGNEVWIRDKADIKNFRHLGRVTQAEKPDLTDVHYDIALGQIRNESDQDLEFRIVGGPWQTIWSNRTAHGVDFKPGELEFRIKAQGDVLASLPEKKYTIPAQKSPVVVDINDVKNIVLSINGIDRTGDWDKFEYRLDPKEDTPWNIGNILKDEDLSGDKSVEIRLKATNDTLPSLSTVVKFIKNLDLTSVVLSDYTNPPVLNGTSNIMDYQIVTVESTSPWTRAANGNTPLPAWVKDFLDNDLLVRISVRDGREGQQDNIEDVVKHTPSNDVKLNEIDYKFESGELVFSNITPSMEYSHDNVNWIDGDNDVVSFGDQPLELTVRLGSLPYVYREFKINRPSAPTGIEVRVVEYPDEDTAMIEVLGVDNTMEYSLDGGSNWNNFTGSHINIDENTHLLVRYKFVDGDRENGKLSSYPTNRLNTIFLGQVSVDAGNGILENTNNTMEYSTDSSNGRDGTWKQATDPQTSISLNLGDKIWVREKGSPEHLREVATIGQEPDPNIDEISYDISNKLISNNTGQNLEYRIDDINWIMLNAGDNSNIDFKPGPLEFRTQANGKNLPSEPNLKVIIPEPEEPPTVRPIDDSSKEIQYFDTATNTWKDIDGNFEYKVGINGEWKPGNEFTLPNSNIIVYVRQVATDSRLASKEASVSFTENLDLDILKLNVAKGVIENTTNKMEYSLDSTNGLNGTWIRATANSTRINFVEGMNIWFREVGKPKVNAHVVINLSRNLIDHSIGDSVFYNVALSKLVNRSEENLQYRIGGGNWHDLGQSVEIYDAVFREGPIEIRVAASNDKLPSLPITLGIIKAPASMPVVKNNDVTNKIELIDGTTDWRVYEYRITENNNTSPWLPGEKLVSEDLTGRKTVEIRRKADKRNLPSQIRTIEFYPNLKLDHIRLSTHVSPLELNGTTNQMDYRIWLIHGSNYWVYDDWTICTPDINGNTKLPAWLEVENIYKIEIRDRNQKENIFEIFP